jgi:dTMP kinase
LRRYDEPNGAGKRIRRACGSISIPDPDSRFMFFSFDGLDGAGKTTQSRLFCDWLRAAGHDVVTCRDPGSTALGERLREIVLAGHDLTIGRRAEMLIYMAARAQMVDEVIAPALAAGKTVVSDRYLLANVVYQGYAGGLDVPTLWEVGRIATGGIRPDLTFVLDLDPHLAAARLQRELDRMERQGTEYRARVRQGFLSAAAANPQEFRVISAGGPVDQVQAEIRNVAESVLRGRL